MYKKSTIENKKGVQCVHGTRAINRHYRLYQSAKWLGRNAKNQHKPRQGSRRNTASRRAVFDPILRKLSWILSAFDRRWSKSYIPQNRPRTWKNWIQDHDDIRTIYVLLWSRWIGHEQGVQQTV